MVDIIIGWVLLIGFLAWYPILFYILARYKKEIGPDTGILLMLGGFLWPFTLLLIAVFSLMDFACSLGERHRLQDEEKRRSDQI